MGGPIGLAGAAGPQCAAHTCSSSKQHEASEREARSVGLQHSPSYTHPPSAHSILSTRPPVPTDVKYGTGGKSRVDFVLRGGGGGDTCLLEVKSVTLAEDLPQASTVCACFVCVLCARACVQGAGGRGGAATWKSRTWQQLHRF